MKFLTKAWIQTQFNNFADRISSIFAKKAETNEHFTQKSTQSILGHVKLSNSEAITTVGEYALDAIEKNASVEGTLANMISQANSNLTVEHFGLTRNPEHCTYDFSNCYRIGNIAVLSLYLDIRNIPQGYDKTLIATLPFKIKNAFPMETILGNGERAVMYLENNGDTGVLLLHANGAAVDESAFLGQIVAIVE